MILSPLLALLETCWKDTGTGLPTQGPDFDPANWWATREARPDK